MSEHDEADGICDCEVPEDGDVTEWPNIHSRVRLCKVCGGIVTP